MSGVSKPIAGHCLCGAVTYRADAEPAIQAVCHCTDCQRQTGSPYTVIVGVPRASLSVEGESLSSFSTVGDDHGQNTERFFCSACGAPLFSVSGALPEMAFLKAGSLDDASWLQPGVEVWTSSAQPWSPQLGLQSSFERGPA
jgi:hypothetical protein